MRLLLAVLLCASMSGSDDFVLPPQPTAEQVAIDHIKAVLATIKEFGYSPTEAAEWMTKTNDITAPDCFLHIIEQTAHYPNDEVKRQFINFWKEWGEKEVLRNGKQLGDYSRFMLAGVWNRFHNAFPDDKDAMMEKALSDFDADQARHAP